MAVVIFVLLAFLLGRFGAPDFASRWPNVKDGMTQAEVKKVLGTPTSIGISGTIGAGNRPVTRWEYKRGRRVYLVDFDYIGPGGTPLVFRTERYQQEWDWRWWLGHASARA
jgi:hypothetical protein